MAKLTKKSKVLSALDREKLYGFEEALATLREHASKKFDETVEVAMNLGVDPRHADQMVRGMVSLPSGTGKDVRVAVFARGDNAEKALAAGADKVGAEDLMEDMLAGNLDYDRVTASPDMMGVGGGGRVRGQGRTCAGSRCLQGRGRRPEGRNAGREPRLRPRQHLDRHDGCVWPVGEDARPQGPDAQPQAGHGYTQRRAGGQGRQGRPGRIPRRKAGHHP